MWGDENGIPLRLLQNPQTCSPMSHPVYRSNISIEQVASFGLLEKRALIIMMHIPMTIKRHRSSSGVRGSEIRNSFLLTLCVPETESKVCCGGVA